MVVRYFDDNDKEIFPKFNEVIGARFGHKLYYLNTWGRKLKVHLVYSIHEIKPSLSRNTFVYKIRDCHDKEFWANEDELYLDKKEVFDKAVELYNRRKIKYIGRI